MKNYFRNLMTALLGRNPYRMELDEVRRAYNLTAKRTQNLEKLYEQVSEKLEEDDRQVRNYQHLTENLRQHLAEKDETLRIVEEDYGKRIAEQKEKNAALKEDLEQTLDKLQKANNLIGKDILAQSLLDKTNNRLEDLCAAMQRGDIEAMMEVTQELDWSSHLTRIAQCHINILKRKNELEGRLYEKRFEVEGSYHK